MWYWFIWLNNDVFKVHFGYHFWNIKILRSTLTYRRNRRNDLLIEKIDLCAIAMPHSITNDEKCSLNNCYRWSKEWCSGREEKRLILLSPLYTWIMSWLSFHIQGNNCIIEQSGVIVSKRLHHCHFYLLFPSFVFLFSVLQNLNIIDIISRLTHYILIIEFYEMKT